MAAHPAFCLENPWGCKGLNLTEHLCVRIILAQGCEYLIFQYQWLINVRVDFSGKQLRQTQLRPPNCNF